jgi:hypothetical protein
MINVSCQNYTIDRKQNPYKQGYYRRGRRYSTLITGKLKGA